MGKACGVLFWLVGGLAVLAQAQQESAASQLGVAPVKATHVVRNGWTDDEAMLAKAMSLRAEKVQQLTGVRFDKAWMPKVSLEWSLGDGAAAFDATYKPETRTVYLPIRVFHELAARHKPSLECLNADLAAADGEFAELIDHELGHALMDQVSRRNGLGPWFTEQRFNASSDPEKLGLDILSEGAAVFFQRLDSPRDDSNLSERTFPASREEQPLYTYKMIVFDGGYWLVRDVLSRYGERGLVWLMANPFVATDAMRDAAVAYRRRALRELSHQ